MPKCFNPRPIQLKEIITNEDGSYLTRVNAPCGKCENCIKRRRMEWCFRMEEELKESKTAYFVTLTYDPEHVVWDKYGNMVLLQTSLDSKKKYIQNWDIKPEDKELRKLKPKGWEDKSIQGFFKKLRITTERNYKYIERPKNKNKGIITTEILFNNLNKGDKIKFYACGEYGEQFGRPHYHAIIYNASRRLIQECWKWGIVHTAKATPETIGYVTKYIDKWRNKKQDWKKPKEFNIQSKGLGEKYIKRMKKFYENNLDINYVINSRGIKIPMARYYNHKMIDEIQRKKKTAIIHSAVEEERNKQIKKLGLEEYNRIKGSNQRFIKKQFEKNVKKRKI